MTGTIYVGQHSPGVWFLNLQQQSEVLNHVLLLSDESAGVVMRAWRLLLPNANTHCAEAARLVVRLAQETIYHVHREVWCHTKGHTGRGGKWRIIRSMGCPRAPREIGMAFPIGWGGGSRHRMINVFNCENTTSDFGSPPESWHCALRNLSTL